MQNPGNQSIDIEGGAKKKLTLKISDHPTTLQRLLHQQFLQGENCDLALSVGSRLLPVHSCVVSCFSAKISRHLLQAKMDSTLSGHYSVTEDGLFYCFTENGEKRVGVNVKEDVLEALVGYIYTGYLSVAYSQVTALLAAAQNLGLEFVVNVIEMFISRNPEVLDLQMFSAEMDVDSADSISLARDGESRNDEARNLESFRHGSLSNGDHGLHSPDRTAAISAELSGGNKEGGGLGPAPLPGVNIKQEIVDPELQELLEFTAQVEGGKQSETSASKASAPTERGRKRERKRRGKEREDTSVNTVMVKLEVPEMVYDSDTSDIVTDGRRKDQRGTSDTEEDIAISFQSAEDDDDENTQEQEYSHQDSTCVKSKVSTSPESTEILVCPQCKRSFQNETSFKQHVFKVHKCKRAARKICPHCDERFTVKTDLKLHCRETHSTFVCEEPGCDFWTRRHNIMSNHRGRFHSKGKFYPCAKCSYEAEDEGMLKTHVAERHGKTYPCPVCQKTFLLKKNLQEHKHSIHRKRQNKTKGKNAEETAESNSSAAGELTSASKEHETGIEAVLAAVNSELEGATLQDSHIIVEASGSAPSCRIRLRKKREKKRGFTCQLCGKVLGSRETRDEHLRSEHPEECFRCQQCPQAFARQEGLTRHTYLVHAVRSWTCIHCGEDFNVHTRFSAHCKTEHGDQKPFRCTETPTCRFRAPKLSNLEGHIQNVHAKERNFSCDKCGNCFPSKEYLRLHQKSCLRLEQHLCSICGEVFTLRQSLACHINNMHGGRRRYSCDQCGKLFSCHGNRNRHMRIHNNAFPYVCETCGQKFRHSNSLKDHVSRKHGERP